MRSVVSRGASLLEVVAAIALLAGTVLSVSALLARSARRVAEGGQISIALAAARDVLERAHGRSVRRTLAGLGCDGEQRRCAGLQRPAVALPLAAVRIEVRLEALDATRLSSAGATRIEVVVSWRATHRRRRVRLVTVQG